MKSSHFDVQRSTFDVRCSIAVVENDGRFLIGQRPAAVPLAGYWEFPGGKIHPDESPEQAAVRECREETGVDVRVRGAFPSHTHQYDHGQIELHFFRCLCLDKSAEPTSPFLWVPRADLPRYRFPAGNGELLKLLTAEIKLA